jgi:hypothetical protein
MSALEFLPFLGHSSIYPPFDDFLTSNGITKRPTLKRNLQNDIFADGAGISMHFSFGISGAEEGFVVKSEGTFIFRSMYIILIEEDKKDGKYSGPLPHGLLVSDTRTTVEQKLGAPKRRNKSSDNYYLDGLVWTVVFEGNKLRYIELHLPDNGWREHGICP